MSKEVATSVPLATSRDLLPVAIVGLSCLQFLLFFRHITGLGLYVDDWAELSEVVHSPFSRLVQSWPADYRPFEGLPWLILYHVFGIHVAGYYAALFGVEYLTSVLVFIFVRELIEHQGLALVCTLLWAVYPGDPSVYWLTTFAYRFGALFALSAFILLMASKQGGYSQVAYAGSVVFCLLCLTTNELYLGVLLALPIVAASQKWRISRGLAIARALPFAALVLISVSYRRTIGPLILHLPDNKPTALSMNPIDACVSLLKSSLIELLAGWFAAVSSDFHMNPQRAILLTAAVGLCMLLWSLGLLALARLKESQMEGSSSWEHLRPGVRAISLGTVELVLGFIPLIFTNQLPNIGEITSRVGAASSLGAALIFSGTIWILAFGAPFRLRARRLSLVVLALAAIAMACMREDHVALEYENAWQKQTEFWSSVIPQVAHARTGVLVVIVAPHVTDWDTIASLPPVVLQTVLDLVFPASHWNAVVAYKQDLRACGILSGHDLGQPVLLRFGKESALQTDTNVRIPYRRVAVMRSLTQPSPGAQMLTGTQRLGPPGCAVVSHPHALLGPVNAHSAWMSIVTGVRHGSRRTTLKDPSSAKILQSATAMSTT